MHSQIERLELTVRHAHVSLRGLRKITLSGGKTIQYKNGHTCKLTRYEGGK